MLYLWDEQANLLVMATSLCAILVDCWKVQRAMSLQFYLAFGFVPWFSLVRLVRIACMGLRVSHSLLVPSNWQGIICACFSYVFCVHLNTQTTKGGAKSGMNEYDKTATKYLSVGGLPIV